VYHPRLPLTDVTGLKRSKKKVLLLRMIFQRMVLMKQVNHQIKKLKLEMA
jgi:hypothetical protein